MKYYFLFLAALLTTLFISCDDDDDPAEVYAYHAHIHQPGTGDKHLGDTMAIEVEFESHTGKPVHNINLRIFDKATHTIVYDEPDEPTVNDTSGVYLFEDQFILSAVNGISIGDWVLEATVSGDPVGQELTFERVEFRVIE